jgi:DNA uptake protein ComE-like DNA-binding protein
MPQWDDFKKYFDFSRSERFGILALCGVLLVTLAVRVYMPFRDVTAETDFSVYEEEIASFLQSVDSLQTADMPETDIESASEIAYFYFDPNTVADEGWKKLGLNERQIRNIRNYQAKGGRFRRKEDVKKLYTIPIVLYESFSPYIRIAEEQENIRPKQLTATITASAPTKTKLSMELNAADSAALTQLPSIGPVLASRIVKYRRLTGGFSAVAQLGEVYGIDSARTALLSPYLSVDSSLIRKIPINKATLKELSIHPYLTDEQARGILYYRRLQKTVTTLDELIKNNILLPEEARRIAPYLSFEQ